jgi:hypothetical protein
MRKVPLIIARYFGEIRMISRNFRRSYLPWRLFCQRRFANFATAAVLFDRAAEQFVVERPRQLMLIGNVPALLCARCSHTSFDEAIAKELTTKTLVLFQKQPRMRIFAYQFTDFIRPEPKQSFEPSSSVRIRDGVDTWDLYDERLKPGMRGTIVSDGINPFDYRVRFLVRKMSLEVEIDADDLEIQEQLTYVKT